MRLRVLIYGLLLMALLATPLNAQPGPPIARNNSDILLLLATFEMDSEVYALAWSPDGEVLALGLEDGSIELRDVEVGNVSLASLSAHSQPVSSLAFSGDGLLLASASPDNTARIWDPIQAEILAEHVSADALFALDFDPASPGIFSYAGASGEVMQNDWFDVENQNLQTFGIIGQAINDLAYSPDGSLLATGGEGGMLHIFDPATGENLQSMDFHSDDITALAWSPDGVWVATASLDGDVLLNPTRQDGEALYVMSLFDGDVPTTLDFNALGDLLAIGGDDSMVYLFSVPESNEMEAVEVGLLIGHTEAITDLAFSPSGAYLATASADGSVKVWAVDTELMFSDIQAQGALEQFCEGAPASQVRMGDFAQVTFTDGSGLRMRVAPGETVITTLSEGSAFDIIGGPQCFDGYTWWEIQLPDGVVGWVAEGDSDGYFIEPVGVYADNLDLSGTSVIFGTVWHDVCDNDAAALAEGCVQTERGVLADGVRIPRESGIRDVEVMIGIGPCPAQNLLEIVTTDLDGNYEFVDLPAGRFCVSIDPGSPENVNILWPGQWSTPAPLVAGSTSAFITVDVGVDELSDPVDFGWDYAEQP